ncbi:MAG TPA: DUF222 domain-containing protein [Ilumatobacteraceae bacterium]
MFGEMLAEYLQWEPAALQEELERLELAARELDSRRLAVRAAAEARQTAALDGHKSTQALLRALCNQPSNVAMAEVRRARMCRDFPQVGDLLMAGRIGVGQIDELVRIRRNARADPYLDAAAVDMLLDHAEHLPVRSFAAVVERWLMWADPDGAWRDQTDSIDNRSAHVVASDGQLSIGVSGGDALTADALRNIFAHFVELEFSTDCESRRTEHGDRADECPLPRTDAQRRFDAIVAIFHRAYAATSDGKSPLPVVNILCDQRTLHDLLGRVGIALADGNMVDLESLTRAQIDAVLAEFVNDPTAMLTRRCETSSGQQIAPQLLIQALLTAQVRRVVLDANSTVIDLGERKRLFSGNARIAATLLQQFCGHPGCEVPADRCQIDHNQSHIDGGRTDQSNAVPECGPHNRYKYRHGWRTRRADNGRTYSIRSDGTLILFVGERPPPFTRADEIEAIRQRLRSEVLQSAWRQPQARGRPAPGRKVGSFSGSSLADLA